MSEILQEFVSSRETAMRVDREHSVIRGVKLLGLESANGRRYLARALQQAVPLYEGAKVNVNHPKGSALGARDYQDRFGSIRNASFRAGEGLFADLHFNPRHALAEQLLWDAVHAPENVGLSHNVCARTTRRDGQTFVEAIVQVQSVDLVADPATTRGLFEGEVAETVADSGPCGGALALVTLDEVRTLRPDLVEALREEFDVELAALRAQVDGLRIREAAAGRRALVARLLREYQLPDPDSGDDGARALVSEVFLESLLSAADERSMRLLCEDRSRIVAAARRWDQASKAAWRPTSREQSRFAAADTVHDARSFAQAIT